jgi:phage major head subunit gpT-like protein
MSYLEFLKAGLAKAATSSLEAVGHSPQGQLADGTPTALTAGTLSQIAGMRSENDFKQLKQTLSDPIMRAINTYLSPNGPALPGVGAFDVARYGIKYAFFQSMNATQDYRGDVLCKETTSMGAGDDMVVVDGAPTMQEWTADRRHVQPKATKFRVENKSYANGLILNEDDVDDNKLSEIYSTAMQLGQAAKWKKKELIGYFMRSAFAGTELCFTGSNMISASHVVMGGPAQSNTLGTVAMTAANVKLAQVAMTKLKTYRGDLYLGRTATHLVVGPNLEPAAYELFAAVNAAGGKDPYLTGQGKMEVLRIDELNDLGGGNAWFVADLSTSKPLVYQNRQDVRWREDRGDSYDRKIIRMGADVRFGLAYSDPFALIGSNAP